MANPTPLQCARPPGQPPPSATPSRVLSLTYDVHRPTNRVLSLTPLPTPNYALGSTIPRPEC